MGDPKWLEEDKARCMAGVALPTCGEKCEGAHHFQAAIDALFRAHAHIAELREALDRRSFACMECGGYDEPVMTRDTPPEAK